MCKVLHVGQFSVIVAKQENNLDRVSAMRLQSKLVGEAIHEINCGIDAVLADIHRAAKPSITWREVGGIDNYIKGELYVYEDGYPAGAAANVIYAVNDVCGKQGHTATFEQYHKF